MVFVLFVCSVVCSLRIERGQVVCQANKLLREQPRVATQAWPWHPSLPCYSGSGLPLVSGANQMAAMPIRYTSVIVAQAWG